MTDIVERLRQWKECTFDPDGPGLDRQEVWDLWEQLNVAADEIERLKGMVRIPLAVHNADAAEYVKRLRKGDFHAADYEPIAELLEKFGSEIERLRDALEAAYEYIDHATGALPIIRAALSQKGGE